MKKRLFTGLVIMSLSISSVTFAGANPLDTLQSQKADLADSKAQTEATIQELTADIKRKTAENQAMVGSPEFRETCDSTCLQFCPEAKSFINTNQAACVSIAEGTTGEGYSEECVRAVSGCKYVQNLQAMDEDQSAIESLEPELAQTETQIASVDTNIQNTMASCPGCYANSQNNPNSMMGGAGSSGIRKPSGWDYAIGFAEALAPIATGYFDYRKSVKTIGSYGDWYGGYLDQCRDVGIPCKEPATIFGNNNYGMYNNGYGVSGYGLPYNGGLGTGSSSGIGGDLGGILGKIGDLFNGGVNFNGSISGGFGNSNSMNGGMYGGMNGMYGNSMGGMNGGMSGGYGYPGMGGGMYGGMGNMYGNGMGGMNGMMDSNYMAQYQQQMQSQMQMMQQQYQYQMAQYQQQMQTQQMLASAQQNLYAAQQQYNQIVSSVYSGGMGGYSNIGGYSGMSGSFGINGNLNIGGNYSGGFDTGSQYGMSQWGGSPFGNGFNNGGYGGNTGITPF